MQHIVETVSLNHHSPEINRLLKDGWVILETSKDDEDNVYVLLGKPANVHIEELKSIIQDYERFGFKEQLFNKIVEENNESFERDSYMDWKSNSPKTDIYKEKYSKLTK